MGVERKLLAGDGVCLISTNGAMRMRSGIDLVLVEMIIGMMVEDEIQIGVIGTVLHEIGSRMVRKGDWEVESMTSMIRR